MSFKTSKILSIIAGSIIIIAFFMPWTKSLFGYSISAWDMVEKLFAIIMKSEKLPEDIGVYLPFVLIVIPICSAFVVINDFKTLYEDKDVTRLPKDISVVVNILVVLGLLLAQAENPFSDFSNIFNLLGIGFYLTVIGNVYYLIDISTTKTKAPRVYVPPSNIFVFCSSCGKQYENTSRGKFCEECGAEMNE